MHDPPRLSPARVLITILVIAAAAAVIIMLLVPPTSRWFWPAAGAFAVSAALALAIPMRSPGQ